MHMSLDMLADPRIKHGPSGRSDIKGLRDCMLNMLTTVVVNVERLLHDYVAVLGRLKLLTVPSLHCDYSLTSPNCQTYSSYCVDMYEACVTTRHPLPRRRYQSSLT